jgi:4-alpha-glucanotransferase
MAALFDGIRVDHLVGLYRTYGRPRIGEPFFNPDQPDAQRAQGQAILTVVLETGLEIIAEDLGTIPDFVRESLASLQLPGCKVLRWERDWHAEGAPFLDPGAYPPASAAMSGTHDTEALADWWDAAPVDEREAFLKLPFVREAANADSPWTDRLRDAILRLLCHSSSRCVFFPLQDIFGWRDRVNTPATVGPHNWTWSLPWPVDDMAARPEAVERAAALGRFVREAGRRAEEIDLPGESRW